MVQALREIIELKDYDEASLLEALHKFECIKSEEEDSQDVMRFLTEEAIQMEKNGTTRTYLILNDELWKQGKIRIDGYFAIALKLLYFSNDINSNLLEEVFGDSNKKNCPAYLIGQLARSKETSKGVGKEYLRIALAYISEARDIVGGRLVYLDCRQSKREYYEKHGFNFLQQKHKSDLIQMYRVI